MDGTIVDTEEYHAKATHTFLLEQKLNISFDNIEEEITGKSDIDVFLDYKKRFSELTEISPQEFYRKKNEILLILLNNHPAIIPQKIRNFIENLKNLKKKIGLVTACERRVMELIFVQNKLQNLFDFRISVEETFFPKPSPSQYFKALRMLRLKSHDASIFEDSNSGIRAALGLKNSNIYKVEWFGK